MCHPILQAGECVASAAEPWLVPRGLSPSSHLGRITCCRSHPRWFPPSSCPAVTHTKSSCPVLACSDVCGSWASMAIGCHRCWGHPAAVRQEELVRTEGSGAAVLPPGSGSGSDLEQHRQHPRAFIAPSLKWVNLRKRKGLPGEVAFNQCP